MGKESCGGRSRPHVRGDGSRSPSPDDASGREEAEDTPSPQGRGKLSRNRRHLTWALQMADCDKHRIKGPVPSDVGSCTCAMEAAAPRDPEYPGRVGTAREPALAARSAPGPAGLSVTLTQAIVRTRAKCQTAHVVKDSATYTPRGAGTPGGEHTPPSTSVWLRKDGHRTHRNKRDGEDHSRSTF